MKRKEGGGILTVEFASERVHPPKDREADATGCDSSDRHSLDIVCSLHAVGDVPATAAVAADHVVARGVVAHEP